MSKIRLLVRKPIDGTKPSGLCWIDRNSKPGCINIGGMEVIIQQLVARQVISPSTKNEINCFKLEHIWEDVPVVFEQESDLDKHHRAHEEMSKLLKSTAHLEICDPLDCKCEKLEKLSMISKLCKIFRIKK